MRAERLPHRIWEPACGPGAIVKVLREAGHEVIASDIKDYGCPNSTTADFLTTTRAPDDCLLALTNPPFRRINEFIVHGLKLVPRVIVLARLALLESEKRAPLFANGHLLRVHCFVDRVPKMHQREYEGRRNDSNAIAFAWFVFDAFPSARQQPALLDWIWADPTELTASEPNPPSLKDQRAGGAS
jgi:hypothetical protein